MTAPKDFPCDWCGKDTGCTCPPCDCKWCKRERGEATALELRQCEAHERAVARDYMRASASRMTVKIDALLGRGE